MKKLVKHSNVGDGALLTNLGLAVFIALDILVLAVIIYAVSGH